MFKKILAALKALTEAINKTFEMSNEHEKYLEYFKKMNIKSNKYYPLTNDELDELDKVSKLFAYNPERIFKRMQLIKSRNTLAEHDMHDLIEMGLPLIYELRQGLNINTEGVFKMIKSKEIDYTTTYKAIISIG